MSFNRQTRGGSSHHFAFDPNSNSTNTTINNSNNSTTTTNTTTTNTSSMPVNNIIRSKTHSLKNVSKASMLIGLWLIAVFFVSSQITVLEVVIIYFLIKKYILTNMNGTLRSYKF